MITRIEGHWTRNDGVLHRERRPRRRPGRLKKRSTDKQGRAHTSPLERDAHCVIDLMA